RRHLRRGFCYQKRVGDLFLLQQESHIPENRLCRVWTQHPGLAKGETSRTRHALLFCGADRVLRAPGVKPGERTPQLGEHPVGVGVLKETRIPGEPAEILFSK